MHRHRASAFASLCTASMRTAARSSSDIETGIEHGFGLADQGRGVQSIFLHQVGAAGPMHERVAEADPHQPLADARLGE